MEKLAQYRLILVTALIGVAAVVRVAFPDVVLPEDKDIQLWADGLLGTGSALAWVVTYYFTDTQKGTLKENQ